MVVMVAWSNGIPPETDIEAAVMPLTVPDGSSTREAQELVSSYEIDSVRISEGQL